MYLINNVGAENKFSIYVTESVGDDIGSRFVVTLMMNKSDVYVTESVGDDIRQSVVATPNKNMLVPKQITYLCK